LVSGLGGGGHRWVVRTMEQHDLRAERAISEYRGHINAYCRRRLPLDLAVEASSETIAVTWRRRDVLPDEPETLPWMYGVARKVVKTVRRSEQRWIARGERARGIHDSGDTGVEDSMIRADEERQVRQALSRLRQSDQEILRLAAWEGLSNGQIAELLHLTQAATDQRLSRAKHRLADEYNRLNDRKGGTR